MIGVDRFADAQNFLIGKILHTTAVIDAELVGNLDSRGAANTMNVGERDYNALVGGDVYTCNTSHLLLHAPQGPGQNSPALSHRGLSRRSEREGETPPTRSEEHTSKLHS